jgi:hypothetical protein
MPGVGRAQSFPRPVVECAKSMVGVAFAEDHLDLVIGVERGIVGQNIEPPTFVDVLTELLGLQSDGPQTEQGRVLGDRLLQPVLIAPNRAQGAQSARNNRNVHWIQRLSHCARMK